jgi:spore coat protein CotH
MNSDPWADTWSSSAQLVVDGTVYATDLRVRFLGSSTRSLPKKSFRITFAEDAEHPGYQRKINLRAEYNDPSTIRNFVAYETFRRLTRIPTPKAGYVDFFLNGEDLGVMLQVERIGGKFLERNGRDREQSMYELARTHDYGAFVPLDNEEQYALTYAKTTGDPLDWSDLYSLVEDVMWEDWLESWAGGPTNTTRLGAEFDLASYSRYLAVMGLIQSQEHVTQNFYFSRQDRGQGPKWEIYPWDLDLTLGCTWDEGEDSALCGDLVTEGWWLEGVVYSGLPVGSPVTCWCNMGINLTLFDPRWGPDFNDHVCGLMGTDWWTTRGPALVSALGTMLTPYVENDASDRNVDLSAFLAAGAEVQDFMARRAAYLRQELGCL